MYNSRLHGPNRQKHASALAAGLSLNRASNVGQELKPRKVARSHRIRFYGVLVTSLAR